MSPDGAIFVNQGSLMCKSADGGKTWTSYPRDWGEAGGNGTFQILGDGTFISVWPQPEGPAHVMVSHDEGRHWEKRSEFTPEVPGLTLIGRALPLYRLPDDTLLYFARFDDQTIDTWYCDVVMFRSADGGLTWSDAQDFHEHAPEGGIAQLPSGRLLAVVRYQRPPWLVDPEGIHTLARGGSPVYNPKSPFKHIFLLESHDQGRTWTNFRQLTTPHGQTFGFPAALSDGTVALVRTNGYNPNRSGVAMISDDEGQTWEDEAYYIYAPEVGRAGNAGYSHSVVLADDLILTIAGTTSTRGVMPPTLDGPI